MKLKIDYCYGIEDRSRTLTRKHPKLPSTVLYSAGCLSLRVPESAPSLAKFQPLCRVGLLYLEGVLL